MKLGEKLQQLRKQSGLSQEQLAAQLGVSRQAVSKWELDETMPDTENVVQLSRLFGVSCDYLLREEVTEPDAPQPAPPGETHLDPRSWTRNAVVLSLTLCVIGLLLTLSGWLNYNASDAQLSNLLIIIGLIVQVLALGLFELATPRMGRKRDATVARAGFYMIACWLVAPALIVALWWWQFWRGYAVWLDTSMLLFYTVLAGALATSLLAVLRHRLLGRT